MSNKYPEHPCEGCGEATRNRRFCGNECRYGIADSPGRVQLCDGDGCTNTFKRRRRSQRFCSQRCNGKTNGARPRPAPASMTCLQCGTTKSRTKPTQRFCTSLCSVEWRGAQRVARWLAGGMAKLEGPHVHIRRYILRRQGGVCAICSIEPIWNGTPITFVLDHISGDAADNDPDNVRLICPNCDSQLDTYKSRNRGKGRHARRERYAAGKSY